MSAAPATGSAEAARGSRLRAWLEVLRAPLLLSPIADVLAGWSLGFDEGLGSGYRAFIGLTSEPGADPSTTPAFALTGWPVLLRAIVVGVCLLAAGMAQNAVADAAEDRRLKPSRPIPRGALSKAAVHAAWIALTAVALAVASTLGGTILVLAGTIAALTGAYHAGLKRLRLPGCLVLGSLRGFDMLLGGYALLVVAAQAAPGSDAQALRYADLDDVWVVAAIYAAYIACASLHASTDDEPAGSGWSIFGVLTGVDEPAGSGWSIFGILTGAALLLLLAGLMLAALLQATEPAPHRWMAPALLGIAAVRLLRAWRSKPPPAVTGVALSNIYFIGAAVVVMGQHSALAVGGAALIMAMFGISRLALRVVPPS